MQNPSNCDNGLSFSLFYYSDYKETPKELLDSTTGFTREYIMSTGGEPGTPGIAVYREGGNLGGVVSTGNLTWTSEVKGSTPFKHRWINLAFRWQPNIEGDDLANGERGGLEFLINLKSYGTTVFPQVHDCDFNKDTKQWECDNPSPVKEEFVPPELMLGCHRTKENQTPRNFGSGGYDELAIWNRRLSDNELPLFLGGHSKQSRVE